MWPDTDGRDRTGAMQGLRRLGEDVAVSLARLLPV